jgi:hypothetical protein
MDANFSVGTENILPRFQIVVLNVLICSSMFFFRLVIRYWPDFEKTHLIKIKRELKHRRFA